MLPVEEYMIVIKRLQVIPKIGQFTYYLSQNNEIGSLDCYIKTIVSTVKIFLIVVILELNMFCVHAAGRGTL